MTYLIMLNTLFVLISQHDLYDKRREGSVKSKLNSHIAFVLTWIFLGTKDSFKMYTSVVRSCMFHLLPQFRWNLNVLKINSPL